jgi:NTE family protein
MLSQANQEAMSFKPVKILTFFPSQDIGEIAKAHSKDLPRMIRYLIGGLGSVNDSSELVSYLLFAPDFCRELIELGYKDCLSQVEEIESFLTLSSPAK